MLGIEISAALGKVIDGYLGAVGQTKKKCTLTNIKSLFLSMTDAA